MLLPGLSGIVVFLARIIDTDFRMAFYTSVIAKKSTRGDITTENLLMLSHEGTVVSKDLVVSAGKVQNSTYRSVFEQLHLKVPFTQFVMDSLITLTFYHTRASFDNCQGVSVKKGLNETIYCIDAEFIKEVVQVDRFNSFFDKCNGYPVTAYKYTLIEYSPELFQNLREAAGLHDQALMQ